MDSERWKRIEQVYYGVLASPPMNRAGMLEELCSDDQEVRREVESLLDARGEAGHFLSAGNLCDQVGELFSEQDAVGQTLGPYQILSAIGSGGMGDVYLARDSRLDRQVALKILPPRFTRESSRVARFRREARAASALSHPNIITIYDIGEVAGTWFIASEYIEGTTLRGRLGNGRIGLSELLDIAIQCALALHAAHQAGIVHRDIKPENIIVRPDGLVKVLDFGLARITSAGESSADVSQAGTLIGTPRYMSPEQARGEKLDARTDIFSLGAVLYEMTTAQQAFTGATTADVFASLLAAPSPSLSECAPRQLERIVSKSAAKGSRCPISKHARARGRSPGSEAASAVRNARLQSAWFGTE